MAIAPNRLLIDLGDFVPGLGKPAEIKLGLYTTALPAMGYDVVGVGELDVRTIKDTRKSPFEQAKIPQICANLVYEDTKKPLLKKPYFIKKMPSGLRVAVIGIMGNMTMNPQLAKQNGIIVLPPGETVRKTIDSLKGKADLFVVLAHSGYEEAKKLAADVPGIDIVLSSHPSTVNTDFERVGNTILMHCKGNSKYVGKLVLNIDSEGKIASAVGTEDLLDAKMEKDAKMQKLIDDAEAAVQEFYNSSNPHVGGPPAPGMPPSQSEPGAFVGAQRCIGCHLSIHQTWQKTKHAQAFDDMKKKDPNATMNPNCLSCHTTGYMMNGGYTTETATPYLRDVGCESCHGPGVRHLRTPSDKGYGATTELTCRKCHDGTNSPKFDYAKYLDKIAHKSTSQIVKPPESP